MFQFFKEDGDAEFFPSKWFLMAREELEISDVRDACPDDLDIEVWNDAGVLEIVLDSKRSIDIESLYVDLQDEFSNDFMRQRGIKSLFYITLPEAAKKDAERVFEFLIEKINGIVCADTDDFMPLYGE